MAYGLTAVPIEHDIPIPMPCFWRLRMRRRVKCIMRHASWTMDMDYMDYGHGHEAHGA
jgi:hypothetical protein